MFEEQADQSIFRKISKHLFFWPDLRKNLKLKNTFSALRYPNYRLWFWSQMFSLFGSWMQSTALGFLIYDLTRSSIYLGLIGFAAGVPTWLFMLYAGVIADRISKRDLLVITQFSMTILAIIVSALAFLGLIMPWHILILAFLLGTANAFEAPARHAFVLDMVEREHLTNAIALNSAMFNAAMALGPAFGGLVYALLGPGWCFAINALSFVPVIAALRMMKFKLQNPYQNQKKSSPLEDLKEGLRYIAREPMVRSIIILIGVVTVFGMSFVTLLPAWAVKILHGDARTNGFLQSSRGLGALAAALIIASLGKFNFKGKLLSWGALMLPVFVLMFSLVNNQLLAIMLIFGTGLSLIFFFNLANSLVQSMSPHHLRGRIMSVYSLTFFGLIPIGALLIGTFASKAGERLAVQSIALADLILTLVVFSLVPKLKKLP